MLKGFYFWKTSDPPRNYSAFRNCYHLKYKSPLIFFHLCYRSWKFFMQKLNADQMMSKVGDALNQDQNNGMIWYQTES